MDKEFLMGFVGEEAAEEILQRHQQELTLLGCRHAVADAIRSAGGRNETAIRALLDEDVILQANDMAAAAASAVEGLKREHGYLFAPLQVTSPGTGSAPIPGTTMEDIAKMSMAEYKRYRGR